MSSHMIMADLESLDFTSPDQFHHPRTLSAVGMWKGGNKANWPREDFRAVRVTGRDLGERRSWNG